MFSGEIALKNTHYYYYYYYALFIMLCSRNILFTLLLCAIYPDGTYPFHNEKQSEQKIKKTILKLTVHDSKQKFK